MVMLIFGQRTQYAIIPPQSRSRIYMIGFILAIISIIGLVIYNIYSLYREISESSDIEID